MLDPASYVERLPNFHIHFSAPVVASRMNGREVVIETPQGAISGDAVLLATGFWYDIAQCRPLAPIAQHIALWSDRYRPPSGPNPEKFANQPYLGRSYQLTERMAGAAPYLRHIFNFNHSATLSMGPKGRVSGLKYGVRRLTQGVVRSFVTEDFEHHLASVSGYNTSELDGHHWVEPPPVAAQSSKG